MGDQHPRPKKVTAGTLPVHVAKSLSKAHAKVAPTFGFAKQIESKTKMVGGFDQSLSSICVYIAEARLHTHEYF